MITPSTALRISPRLLGPLQVLWLITLVASLAALFLSVPILWSQAHQFCEGATCGEGPQLTRSQLYSLHAAGLSLDFYAAYIVGLNVIFGLVYCAIAALIFLHRSRERMAMLSAFFLVVFGALTFPQIPEAIASAHPILHVPVGLSILVGATLLLLFFFLFPNGRFVPRWAPWLVPIVPLLRAPSVLFPDSPYTLDLLPPLIGLLPFYGVLLFIVGAQAYRFRRVSTTIERQQTKWVVLGVGIGMTGFIILVLANIVVSSPVSTSIGAVLIGQTALYAFMMLIPLSVGLAILRHRLWEADALIKRTLVYGSLTISLAALYLFAVIALQAAFRALTGQHSELAVAIATLLIAALFNPWRHRLQAFIDRRFYRRKYDAARTLASLQATLRDEVDLERLTAEMLTAVQDTVEPRNVSLWLRQERTS